MNHDNHVHVDTTPEPDQIVGYVPNRADRRRHTPGLSVKQRARRQRIEAQQAAKDASRDKHDIAVLEAAIAAANADGVYDVDVVTLAPYLTRPLKNPRARAAFEASTPIEETK